MVISYFGENRNADGTDDPVSVLCSPHCHYVVLGKRGTTPTILPMSFPINVGINFLCDLNDFYLSIHKHFYYWLMTVFIRTV